MASTDEIFQRSAGAYDKARALYDSNKLDECIAATRVTLADYSLPRYHRIKTLLLLSACLEDWYEAQELVERAETLWRATWTFHTRGEDKGADESLDELGADIEFVQQQMLETRPAKLNYLKDEDEGDEGDGAGEQGASEDGSGGRSGE